ncbi:hypothetical protein KOW79_021076 [Hemibagrus wyckioides]|uniref:Uncharacterized protein n=1 Tax=Hemibagrus wyckioides TaxID=337641 RepID=A0A9D3N5V7_9TELE|nr:hypothetical protein KOW79_021076 [Hemibagrus wyckioides]
MRQNMSYLTLILCALVIGWCTAQNTAQTLRSTGYETNILDIIGKLIIDKFTAAELVNATFITEWFQIRLRPFLSSVSKDFLSSLGSQTFSCETYQIVVQALSSQESLMKEEQKQMVFTWFIFPFLLRNDLPDPRCLSYTSGSNDWLEKNLGSFSDYASLEELKLLNANFSSVEVLDLLSSEEKAQFILHSGVLANDSVFREVFSSVITSLDLNQLGSFFEAFSQTAIQMNMTSNLSAISDTILNMTLLDLVPHFQTFSPEDFALWFQTYLSLFLPGISPNTLSIIPMNISCDSYREIVKGLDNVYSDLSATQSNTVFNYTQDYVKYQSSQGLSCYGTGSFYVFLKQLFLNFGFPDLKDFLSLIPGDRLAELLGSISLEELSEFLNRPDTVINASDLCTLLNNYNRTNQYLEMETVLSSALASYTLECVLSRALTASSQAEVEQWFDVTLLHYLPYLNSHLISSAQLSGASCLSYRKLVSILGDNYNFSATDFTPADVYSSITVYLNSSDGSPRCYNSSDPLLNSTAWFADNIGFFITFITLTDLQSFLSGNMSSVFLENSENLQLFNNSGISTSVLEYYTNELYIQNPDFSPLGLPAELLCRSPASVFERLGDEDITSILNRINDFCTEINPEVTAVLVAKFPNVSASIIQSLGSQCVGLTVGQISSAPSDVINSSLSILSSINGWDQGQVNSIIQSIISAGFTISSASSLESLGTLIGGVLSANISIIPSSQLVSLSQNPTFINNIISAPVILQNTFVQKVISVDHSKVLENVPDALVMYIPLVLLTSLSSADVSLINNKSWNHEQAMMLFGAVASASDDPEDLSTSILQGFSCSSVQTLPQQKAKDLVKACRPREGRDKVHLKEAQLTCMYNYMKDDPSVNFTDIPSEMLLYYSYEKIQKVNCQAYFSALGRADFSVLSLGLDKKDILFNHAKNCLNVKRKFLSVLREQKIPLKKLRTFFTECNSESTTVSNITAVTISDPSFPFGFNSTQFDLYLDITVLQDNLAAITEKVVDTSLQTVILNKLNQSKAVIMRYLSMGNHSLGSAEINVVGSNICTLDISVLENITAESLTSVLSPDLSSCSIEQKSALYIIANSSFSNQRSSSTTFYQLIRPYLGGAPVNDIQALSTQNISMDITMFNSLNPAVLKILNVSTVRALMGVNLADLKLFENSSVVQSWVAQQNQSDLNTLNLGIINHNPCYGVESHTLDSEFASGNISAVLCNFSIPDYACSSVAVLSSNDLVTLLTCKLPSSLSVSKDAWKLFFQNFSGPLDDALESFSNVTDSSIQTDPNILDAIGEVIIDKFTAAELVNATFITVWFQIRLRPFLSSVSKDFLSSLGSQTFSCETYQIVVQALSSQESLMKEEQKQMVFTWFIFPFLLRNDLPDPRCLSNTSGSNDWLEKNLGSFSDYASLEVLKLLNANFSSVEVLDLLSSEQKAQFILHSGVLANDSVFREVFSSVITPLDLNQLGSFFEAFSQTAIQMNMTSIPSAISDTILNMTLLDLVPHFQTFSPEDFALWFQTYLSLFLPGISPNTLSIIPMNISCDSYREIVKGLDNVYSDLSATQSNTVFNYTQDYVKYQSSQGLSCYGTGSFYVFLKQLFLNFGFPDLKDFLSLIPGDRLAELLGSISPEELSEFLNRPDTVINASDLCTLLNNYNRTNQYLEMETVLSSALASYTLECVLSRALTASSQAEVEQWFDVTLLHYLPYLNSHLISSAQLSGASCLSYRKLVSILGDNYNFSATDFTPADVYSSITVYLNSSDGSPRCYNSSDPLLNSTAWFADNIGFFITFITLTDLQSFLSGNMSSVFLENSENLQLFNNSGISTSVLEYYTNELYIQNPDFSPLGLPAELLCRSPASVFERLGDEDITSILNRINDFCTEINPEVTAVLVAKFPNVSASIIQSLGSQCVGLTVGQISSAPSDVINSSLSILSSINGWDQGQVNSIIQSIISAGFTAMMLFGAVASASDDPEDLSTSILQGFSCSSVQTLPQQKAKDLVKACRPREGRDKVHLKEAQLTCMYNYMKDDPSVNFTDIPSEMLLYYSYEKIQKVNCQAYFSALGRADFSVLSLGLDKKDILFNHAKNCLLLASSGGNPAMGKNLERLRMTNVKRKFLSVLREQKIPLKKLRTFFTECNSESTTVSNITAVTISDPSFPFGFNSTQFDLYLDITVLQDNLAAITEKVVDTSLQTVILNKLNQSKAVIMRYLSMGNHSLGSAEINVVGSNICTLDISVLENITAESLTSVLSPDLSSCSIEQKSALYIIANSSFSNQRSSSTTFYQLIRPYLGGAPVNDIQALSTQNISMDITMFNSLNPAVLKILNVSTVRALMGVNLADLKLFENSSVVQSWVAQQNQSDLNTLNLGIINHNPCYGVESHTLDSEFASGNISAVLCNFSIPDYACSSVAVLSSNDLVTLLTCKLPSSLSVSKDAWKLFFQNFSGPLDDALESFSNVTDSSIQTDPNILDAIGEVIIDKFTAAELVNATFITVWFQIRLRPFLSSVSKDFLSSLGSQTFSCETYQIVVQALSSQESLMKEEQKQMVFTWFIFPFLLRNDLPDPRCLSNTSGSNDWLEKNLGSFSDYASLEVLKLLNANFSSVEVLDLLSSEQKAQFILHSGVLANDSVFREVFSSVITPLDLNQLGSFFEAFSQTAIQMNMTSIPSAISDTILNMTLLDLVPHFQTFSPEDFALWFQTYLSLFLPGISPNTLSIIPMNISCDSYREISASSLESLGTLIGGTLCKGSPVCILLCSGKIHTLDSEFASGNISAVLCNFSIPDYACSSVAVLSSNDLVTLLTCKLPSSLSVSKDAWKLFFQNFSGPLDDALESFSNVTDSSIQTDPNILDAIGEVIIDKFTAAELVNATFITVWFQIRLRPFLSSVSKDFLSSLGSQTFSCETYQIVVQALSSQESLMKEEQKQMVFTWFIFPFLLRNDLPDPRCLSNTSGSNDWLEKNLGSFSDYASLEVLKLLNANFSSVEVLDLLSSEQKAQFILHSGVLANDSVFREVFSSVITSLDLNQLGSFFEAFSQTAIQMNMTSIPSAISDTILNMTLLDLVPHFQTFSPEDFALWFQTYLSLFLPGISPNTLSIIPMNISCDSYREIVKGLDNVYSDLSATQSNTVFNYTQDYVKYQSSQGLSCYGTGSFYVFLKQLFLNFGFPDLKDFLSLIPGDRLAELLGSISPEELSEFLNRPDTVINASDLCTLLNNYNRTNQYLEMETVLSSALASYTLECVLSRALTASSQAEVEQWFDVTLLHYLPYLNSHLISSAQLSGASCLSYRKLVSILGDNYNFSATDFTPADVYSSITVYLNSSDGSPRCYNSSDPLLNSTAWFADNIGFFITFITLTDLQSFLSGNMSSVFLENSENLQLFNNSGISTSVLEYYTNELYIQNPDFSPLGLPAELLCRSPASVFERLGDEDITSILNRINDFCTEINPEVTAVLVAKFPNVSASIIQSLGSQCVGLTVGQISSAPSDVINSSLSILSSINGWDQGQVNSIIQSIISAGFTAMMLFGAVASASDDPEDLSTSILQGFSCSSVQTLPQQKAKDLVKACRPREGRDKVHLKEAQLTCMYNYMKDDPSVNFTDIPSEMLLYYSYEKIQKVNCQAYFSALGRADFSVLSLGLDKKDILFNHAKNCLLLASSGGNPAMGKNLERLRMTNVKRKFLSVLREQKIPLKKLRTFFTECNSESTTVSNITAVTISDPSFPFGFNSTQFDLYLDITVLQDNLAAITEKVVDTSLQTVILNKLNQSKAVIMRYLSMGNHSLGSAEINVVGSNICTLDISVLENITAESLTSVLSPDLSSCSIEQKSALYIIANSSFSNQRSSSTTFYQLIRPYLGGAPVNDIQALSTQNISMDITMFNSLNPAVLKILNVSTVRALMGVNLADLKLFENSSVVQSWVAQQNQSDLNTLNLGIINHNPCYGVESHTLDSEFASGNISAVLCNFSIPDYACSSVAVLSSNDLVTLLTCKLPSSLSVSKDAWKLFFQNFSGPLDDALESFSNVTDSSIQTDPNILDAIGEVIIDKFTAAELVNATFITVWFQIRLRPFLSSVSKDFLSSLGSQTFSCETYQIVVQALSSQESLMKEEQKQMVFTWFIFPFLLRNDLPDPRCLSNTSGSNDWLEKNLGSFSDYASLEVLKLLNANFSSVEVLDLLSSEQKAQFILHSGVLANDSVFREVFSSVITSLDLNQLGSFFEAFSQTAIQMNMTSIPSAISDTILNMTLLDLVPHFQTFSPEDFALWFQTYLSLFLPGISPNTLSIIPMNISCDSYREIVKGLDNVYSDLSATQSNTVFNYTQDYVKYQSSQGLSCYGTGSFYVFLKQLFLNFGFPDLKDFLSLIPGDRLAELLGSISPEELSEFLNRPDTVINASDLCTLLNNYNRTNQYLEMETVLSSALASYTLECVLSRALTASSQAEVEQWFDVTLLHYLPYLNSHLISSAQLSGASCLSYRKLVSILGDNYNFSATDFTPADVYSSITVYLNSSDGSPRCYNSSDPLLNSTAWFADNIGFFITFITLTDLQSFLSGNMSSVFLENSENLQLFNNSGISTSVLEYYTNELYIQNPDFSPLGLPAELLCRSPASVFERLGDEDITSILNRINDFCTEINPEVTAVLVAKFPNVSASIIQSLGSQCVGLTVGQISSAPSDVINSSLSILSSINGWDQGQVNSIIQSIISAGFTISSASSLESLGTLIGGVLSANISIIPSSQLVSLSQNPTFINNIISAPVILQNTFVQKVISVDHSKVLENVPDALVMYIPLVLLTSLSSVDVSLINNKSWSHEQAMMLFGAVASASDDPEDLSTSILQGFSCSSVQTLPQQKAKDLVKACRPREGRDKVHLKEAQLTCMYNYMKDDPSVNFTDIPSEMLLYYSYEKIQKVNCQAYFSALGRADFSVLSLGLDKKDILFNHAKNCLLLASSGGNPAMGKNLERLRMTNVKRKFLSVLREQKIPLKKLRTFFTECNSESTTVSNITAVTISDPSFPFGFNSTQFDLYLDITVLQDNLAAITEKVVDTSLQTVILNKLNQSKAVIMRYLSMGNHSLGSAEINVVGSNICTLDISVLENITAESLTSVLSPDLSSCSIEQKSALYIIANSSFSNQRSSSTTFYQLIRPYLGGAPVNDIQALSTQNISMDITMFNSLNPAVLKILNVSTVRALMGVNLADLKLFENSSVVQSWVAQQNQSDLNTLNLGIINHNPCYGVESHTLDSEFASGNISAVLCNFSIPDYACSSVAVLSSNDLVTLLTCKLPSSLSVSKDAWKLFFQNFSGPLDDALESFSNVTDSSIQTDPNILDAIGEVIIDKFTAAELVNATFITVWFQIRLRPFLSSVSKDFLSSLGSQTFSCETYQIVVQALSSQESLMKEEQKQMVFTWFIFPFLLRNDLPDPRCLSNTSGSNDWLEKNLGSFSDYASLEVLKLLNANFSSVEVLDLLSSEQKAQFILHSGVLANDSVFREVFSSVITSLDLNQLGSFFEAFSQTAIQMNMTSIPSAISDTILNMTLLDLVPHFQTFSPEDFALWFQTYLSLFLPGISPNTLSIIPMNISCDSYREIVKGLDNVYSDLSATQSNTVFNYTQDYVKYQSSQGLSCYGTGSFYVFLKQLFLNFGFPDLKDFLSLIPGDRLAELLGSISPEELSEFLNRPDTVINASDLCTLLNNYNRTNQYLEMETVLSSALASYTLECVLSRALTASSQAEVEQWFDVTLLHYLPYLNSHLISSAQLSGASCLSYRKLVSILGDNYNFSATDFTPADVYSSITVYLNSSDGSPRCYNSSDPLLNSTAWFADNIGFFITFITLTDLQSFLSGNMSSVFLENSENLQLFNNSGISTSVLEYYTNELYIQNPDFSPLGLPAELLCRSPASVFERLGDEDITSILNRINDFCTEINPEVTAVLVAKFPNVSASIIQSLGSQCVGLTVGQISSAPSDVINSSLSILSSINGWDQGQVNSIIQSIISAGFTISSASSLESLGTLIGGVLSANISIIPSSQLVSLSQNPTFINNIISAPVILQNTFVQKVISVDHSKVLENVPDALVMYIPLVLLTSLSSVDVSLINNKSWSHEQAMMLFGAVASASDDPEDLSTSILQGFSCSSVQTLPQQKAKDLVKACRPREGRDKVHLKEAQLTCMYNYMKDDPSVNFTDIPSEMLLYYSYEKIQKVNCQAYFSALGRADFSVLSLGLDKKDILFNHAKNCLGISVSNITAVTISDPSFPFGFNSTQFDLYLDITVLQDNLAAITEKVVDTSLQTVILNKLNQIYPSGLNDGVLQLLGSTSRVATTDDISKWNITIIDTLSSLMDSNAGHWGKEKSKAVIMRYLSMGNHSLGSAEINVVGSNICTLDISVLENITAESLTSVLSPDLSSCSIEQKSALYIIANSSFSNQRSSSTTFYQLIRPYLGGAPVEDIQALSIQNISMDITIFTTLNPTVLMVLNVSTVKDLMGLNVADLKLFENSSIVQFWVSQQNQSDLDILNLGITNTDSVDSQAIETTLLYGNASAVLCNFSITDYACSSVAGLSTEDLAKLLTCETTGSIKYTKDIWKLFFNKFAAHLDEALDKVYSMTLISAVADPNLLDAIGEVIISKFTAAQLVNAIFITEWFQIRLRPFLSSVSKDFLSSLSSKTFSCETYQIVVQALSSQESLMKEEQKQMVFTWFIFPFLLRNDLPDPRCLSNTSGSNDWLEKNLGSFSDYASLEVLKLLNANFSSVEVLGLLSSEQKAQFILHSGVLANDSVFREVFSSVITSLDLNQLGSFLEAFNETAIQMNMTSIPSAISDTILNMTLLDLVPHFQTFSPEDFALWFQTYLSLFLHGISPNTLSIIPMNISCDSYREIVKGFNDVYSDLSTIQSIMVFNYTQDYLKYQSSQGLSCYGTGSFYVFLKQLFLNFGFPDLKDFLSLIPGDRLAELLGSISLEELSEFLNRPDTVINASDLCTLLNNYNRTNQYLEMETVLSSALASYTLECVLSRALTASSQAEVEQWFDVTLLHYLPYLNSHLISSAQLSGASCLSYRKLVSILGDSYNFSATDFTPADVYSSIKVYLNSSDGSPRCYNSSDPLLNSTAWFADNIGFFITFITLTDLQSFLSDSKIGVFLENSENLQLFSNSKISASVTEYYTTQLYIQNPNFNPLRLPGGLLCEAPSSAFVPLGDADSQTILLNINKSCNEINREVTVTLVEKFPTLSASTIQLLGSQSVGLTAGQISSAPPNVIYSALSILSNINSWDQGQASALIQSIISAGFKINSTSSLLSLGTLIEGVPSAAISSIPSSQLLTLSHNPSFINNILSAPVILQETFAQQVISADQTKVIENVPDSLVMYIPVALLSSLSSIDVSLINNKSWSHEQAMMLFDSVTSASDNPENLSASVLQGFSCSSVQTLPQQKIKDLVKACRPRAGRDKVLLKEAQLTCMYKIMKEDTVNYADVPSDMLLYYSYDKVKHKDCRSYFTALGGADFSVPSSILNIAATQFDNARDCLGISGASLTRDQVEVLGNMACTLDSSYIQNSDPLILEKLKNCEDLSDSQISAIQSLLLSGKTVYGNPLKWNAETLGKLSILPLYFKSDFWGQFSYDLKKTFIKLFMPFLRNKNIPIQKLKNFFVECNSKLSKINRVAVCTTGQITAVTIADASFPLGYDATQFDLCLNNTILQDNLAAITEKVVDSSFQTVILNKLNQIYPSGINDGVLQLLGSTSRMATIDDISKWKITIIDTLSSLMNPKFGNWAPEMSNAVISRYLSVADHTLGTAEINAVGSSICSLDVSVLENITAESLKKANTLDLSSCSIQQKSALYIIGESSFSGQNSTARIYYQLIRPYLGGAPVQDIQALSIKNVNMDVTTFMNLNPAVIMSLNVSTVEGLLGVNLADLKLFENSSVVQSWVARQSQSDLNTLNIGLIGGKIPSVTSQPNITTVTTSQINQTTSANSTAQASEIHLQLFMQSNPVTHQKEKSWSQVHHRQVRIVSGEKDEDVNKTMAKSKGIVMRGDGKREFTRTQNPL